MQQWNIKGRFKTVHSWQSKFFQQTLHALHGVLMAHTRGCCQVVPPSVRKGRLLQVMDEPGGLLVWDPLLLGMKT